MEYMCNADGEFFEVYQDEFNQIYDRIESILKANLNSYYRAYSSCL